MPEPLDDNVELLSDDEANAAFGKSAIYTFLASYIDQAFVDAGPLPPYLVFEITSYLQQATDHPTPPPQHLIDMMFDHMVEMAQPVEGMPQFAEIADWVRSAMFETLYDVELIPLNPLGVITFTNNLPKRSLGEVLKEILEALKRMIEATKRLDMPSNWDLVARPFRRSGPFRLLATDTMIAHRSFLARGVRSTPNVISVFRFKEKLRAPANAVMVTENLVGTAQLLSDTRIPESLNLPNPFTSRQTQHFSGGILRLTSNYSSLQSRDVELEFIVKDPFAHNVGDVNNTYMSLVYDVRVEYWGFETS